MAAIINSALTGSWSLAYRAGPGASVQRGGYQPDPRGKPELLVGSEHGLADPLGGP